MTDAPHLETLEALVKQVPPESRGKKFSPMETISLASNILHSLKGRLSEDERTLLHGVMAQAQLDTGVGGEKERQMVAEADEIKRRQAEAAQSPQNEPNVPPSIVKRLR
jgi:hypothetical protein